MEVELGQKIKYHHRAAVARYNAPSYSGGTRSWWLTEGVENGETTLDAKSETFGGVVERHWLKDLFADWPELKRARGEINKTVMVWPEFGEGVIIGKVRRGRGTSHSSSRGISIDDYEGGYFDPIEYFDLYAVKREMRGTNYILVPTWAVS